MRLPGLLGLSGGVFGLALAGCNDYAACAGLSTGGSAETRWEWTANEVMAAPMVADVDGDGAVDVVVNTTRIDGEEHEFGEVVLLDGQTGAEKWRIAHYPAEGTFGSYGRSTVAVADVSGDGLPDIIYAGRGDGGPGTFERSTIHAVDGDGELLWTATSLEGETAWITVEHGAPAVANLDDDPEAEIVIGATVIDHDGRVVWNQDGDGGVFGAPAFPDGANAGMPIYPGALSTLADLDGDGRPEIVSGRDAWTVDWSGGPAAVSVTKLWTSSSGRGNDGWPAVADLDGDGAPEVVLTAWPEIRVLDGRTGELWCGADPSGAACASDPGKRTQPSSIAGGNLGGPATIADFDGDGRPEVAIAGGAAFAVYDFNRPGEEIAPDVVAEPGAMFVRWSARTLDNSSASTGSSAFDLDGDGDLELLYQDECFFRVFDGATGEVLLEQMNSSATIHEYPVVADLDGDMDAEILVIANRIDDVGSVRCLQDYPGYVSRQGVFALGPGEGLRWAPARSVWTQHTQHGTDVDASGNVPRDEADHWRENNSFREQLPAPDANGSGSGCG